MIVKTASALALAMALTGAVSASTVLFNNFGPGDSYNTGSGWTIGTGSDWIQGSAFTVDPNAAADFFQIQLTAAITHVTGANFVTIHIYDTVGGNPGNLLDSATGSNFHPFGQAGPPTVFTFNPATILERGEQYFFVAQANGPGGDWLVWNMNDQGDSGPHAQKQGVGGAWNVNNLTRGAMRVEGTLIPAPGVLALLGLAGLVGTRRRR